MTRNATPRCPISATGAPIVRPLRDYVVAAALIVLCSAASIRGNQLSSDDGTNDGDLSVSVELGDHLPGRPGHYNEYRVYADSPSVLTARACVLLESSPAPAILLRDIVEQVGQFRLLRLGDEVPLRITWVPIAYDSETGPRTISDRTPVRLEPSSGSCWLLEFERLDNVPFERSEYDLEVRFAGLQSATRRIDDVPWRGSGPTLPFTLKVFLAAASTIRERARVHEIAAFDAMERHDFEAEVDGYAKALALEPGNTRTISFYANALLRAKRYSEAASWYERLELVPSRADILILGFARAYLGMGKDADARALLEKSGYTQIEIAEELTRMRRVLEERRR